MKRLLFIFIFSQLLFSVVAQNNLVLFGTVRDSVTATPIPNHQIILKTPTTNTLIHFNDTLYSGNNGLFNKFYSIQNYNSNDSAYIITKDVNNNLYTFKIHLNNPAIEQNLDIFTPLQNCNANFHHIQDAGNVSTRIFTDYSAGSILSWSWDFGDGNYSMDENPIHTYANQGIYNVELTILCANGQSSTQQQSVSVPNQNCNASFIYHRDSIINADRTYLFEDQTNAPNDQVTGWYWDFDNGSVSYLQAPVQHFLADGKYEVCLTTYTQLSCLSSYCDSIEVESSPHFSFGGQIFKDIIPANAVKADLFRELTTDWEIQVKDDFDTLGFYHFYNYPMGKFLVHAHLGSNDADSASYFPTYTGNSLHWQSASSFINDTESWSKDIQLYYFDASTLQNGQGSLSGHITDSQQQGAWDILVFLKDDLQNTIKYTYTNSQGHYSFDDLAFGTYTVYPEITGIMTTPSQISLNATNQDISNINFHINQQIITGIWDNYENAESLKIYPNPVKDVLYLEWPSSQKSSFQIEILDVSGRKIVETFVLKEDGEDLYILDLNHLKSGLYLLNLKNKDTGKVLINRIIKK